MLSDVISESSRMLAQALSLTMGSQKKEKRANSTVTNALDQLA